MIHRVRIRSLKGTRGDCIKIATAEQEGFIFMRSPVRSLLDRDAAVKLAEALIEHIGTLPKKEEQEEVGEK